MTTQQDRPVTPDATMEDLAQAVDDAAAAVAALPPEHRAVANGLRKALDALNRAALTTIVRTLRDDDATREVLYSIVDDPVVRLAMLVHGIIRADPSAPVQAPEPAAAGPIGADSGAPTFIPLTEIGIRTAGDGWVDAGAVEDVPRGELVVRSIVDGRGDSTDVIIVNIGGQLWCYLNVCAHQGLPLDEALIDEAEGTLTCPWHALCYDVTNGECMSLPGAALQPLPVREDGSRVWVRPHG